jgi:divalent metal cation (Fe/Co/Zn/Cd) transporter
MGGHTYGPLVALAKVGAAVVASSPAMAAEASHSFTDTANEPDPT